jgi:hypothetical protein
MFIIGAPMYRLIYTTPTLTYRLASQAPIDESFTLYYLLYKVRLGLHTCPTLRKTQNQVILVVKSKIIGPKEFTLGFKPKVWTLAWH